ncbi:hypothetical protein L2Y94_09650 [Luteibacter aegosomatis]|uniref:hypothetical protein n=1 Tax=Luteibacter aegosomatis TaxID=2911537 RepID=UPI001FF7064E|nr:hypothetical protein [Luteibacter aegosomatis]UPG87593.1 hypothetical protein L2Y94_09650 [Luteibacter aegosomatis]
MSASAVGFFLGVAPGIGYTLWNLARGQRALEDARRTAHEHGEMLDMASSPRLRFYYLFKPAQFVCPQDGEGVRQAKMRLLAMRKSFIGRHALGGLLVIIGGFVGVAIGLGVG